VPGVDRDDDGGGGLAPPGSCVCIEVPGGEDANVFGVKDRFLEAGEKFVWVLGAEGDGEGVEGELGFVAGEEKAQPGVLAHRERFVELGRESDEIVSEACGGGGRVGHKQGDRPTIIDLGRDREGEDTVRIPKDTSSYVGKGGSYQRRLLVLRGRGTGSVQPSFGSGERVWRLDTRRTVAG